MPRLPLLRFTISALIFTFVLLTAGRIQAQSNWQPMAGGTYDWSNIANWAGGIPDSNTATANFTAVLTGNQTINLTADRTLNVLNIGSSGGTYTLAGAQNLTLDGANPLLTMTANSQNVFLNMNSLTILADTVITNNSTTGTLNIGVSGTGQIANATFGLTFGGSGAITVNSILTGTTGTLTKTGTGILTFTDPNAFGSANSTTQYGTVRTGNIAVNGGEMNVQNLRLTAPGMNSNRVNGTSVTRNLSIASGAFFTVNGTLTIDPSDSVYVTQVEGPGTLQLRNGSSSQTNPSLANDWGPNGGDANPWGSVVSAPVNLGPGTHWMVGKTNRNDVSRYAGDFRFDAPLSGSGNIQVRGLNVNSDRSWHLVFNANNSGYTGSVSIANADLNLTNANALSAANSVTFNSVVDANTLNRGILFLWGHSVTIGSLNDLNTSGTTSQIRNGARDVVNGGTNTNNSGATNGVALGLQSDSILTINQSTAGTFFGVIADGPNDNSPGDAGPYRTLGIVKTGPATLTLTGANTYTGPTTINAGILSVPSLSNGGVAGTLGAATPASTNLTFSGGTLQFTGSNSSSDRGFTIGTGGGTIEVTSAAGNATFSGVVTGSAALTKTGPGNLELASATSTYTGAVNVNAGTLRIQPNASSGQYSVASNAQLTVTNPAAAGTLPAASLALANGSRVGLVYNQAGNPTAAFLNVTGTNGFSVTSGTAQIELTNSAGFAVGSFPLIDYVGSIGGAGFNGLALVPTRLGATLVNNVAETRVDLNITTLSDSITWTGTINGTWDVGSAVNVGGTNNWKLTTAGTATNFVNGDTVLFPSTGAATTTVTINSAVTPISTTVDSAASPYTFQGTGGIVGTGGLTKTGSSILTLLTANSYSGSTTIAAGAGNGISIGNGGTTGSISGNITNNQALLFNRSDAIAFAGIISGNGTLEKLGAGSLALTGANTFTGRTTLTAGTLTINGDGALGTAPGATVADQLILAGGTTLQASAATTLAANRGITLGTGSVTIDTQANNVTVNGVVTGPAGIIKNGTGTLALTGLNNYAGGTTVNAGALHFTNAASLGTGTITFGAGVIGTGSIAGTPPTPFFRHIASANVTLSNNIVLPSPGTNTTYTFMKNSSDGQINFTGIISGGSATTKLFLNSSTGGDNTTTYRFANANTFVAQQIEIWRGGVVIANMSGLGAPTNQLVMDGNENLTLGDLRFEVGGTFPNPVNLLVQGPISTNANNVTMSGVISGISPMLKLGTGIMTLTGTNTNTGTVTISAGTLRINGNNAAATGTITVNAGAAFGGTGTIGGAVTFAAGSTLAPGASIGTTTVANTVTLNGNTAPNQTQWQVELNGIAANSLANADQANVDRLVLTGAANNLNLATSTTNRIQLNLQQLGGNFTLDGNPVFYRIATANAGTNFQTNGGTFDPSHFDFVATGFSASSYNLQIDGNHLVLSFVPVPEPTTMIGLTVAVLAAVRLRRRTKPIIQG